MKHFLTFLLLIPLIIGCSIPESKEKAVNTVIEDKNNIRVALNYPIFNKRILDKAIDKEVKNIYDTFKKDYQPINSNIKEAELNIDYDYQFLDNRIINVSLKTYINASTLANPLNSIKTFVYDTKKSKLLKLKDVISKDELKKLVPLIQNKLIEAYKDCLLLDKLKEKIGPEFINYPRFFLTNDELVLYFDPYEITAGYCNIIKIALPLDQVNLIIPLERGISNDYIFPELDINKSAINPKKPSIALTFDDGPSKYTKDIAAILNKYKVKATFFVIGNKVELYQNVLRSLVKNGSEIGNHSYNHKWLTKVTDKELIKQIEDTNNIIKQVTGHTPKIFRPTYGSINKHLRDKVGLDIIMWTVDTKDWKIKSSKKIADNTIKKVKDKDIILMHDNHYQTIKAIDIMIPALLKEGYQFVTIGELNEINALREYQKQ